MTLGKELIKDEQILFQTVLGQTSDSKKFLAWAKTQAIEKNCSESYSWTQLLKGKVKGLVDVANMPFQDHAKIFQRFDGTRVFISQPYSSKEKINNSAQLKEWLSIRGLEITLLSEELSWHYPGNTVLIQVEVQDEIKYLTYIEQRRGTYSII